MSDDSGRDERGRWLPGTSGNPKGRPPTGETFLTLINGALGRELETHAGVKMTVKEFISQIIAGVLVNGRYTFLNGEELQVSSRDLLPFLLNVLKRLEPGTTQVDVTSGGERIDFSKMDSSELAQLFAREVAGLVSDDGGDEAARDYAEDSKSGSDAR